MASHLFISVGLLLAAIFLIRGIPVLTEPGLGIDELYILGGFAIAALLIHSGLKERRQSKID